MLTVVAPIVIGLVYAALNSLIAEPHRRRFNAVFVAGAGAAYLSGGGFGPLELAFTAVATYCAYRGLDSWAWIGVAWLLHTVWDALHHLYGNPILPFAEHSSLGCAICDPVIALWCFAGGPSVADLARSAAARLRPRARRGGSPGGAGASGAPGAAAPEAGGAPGAEHPAGAAG
ncbi:hypothetical protein HNR12_001605 [Streptomonospora nanhaiensis]|uniref:Integral membrane protein n=3 Tax=Streptomonospora nanhaiensis TaxID=1323731 RepID=A0A853BIJ4_9ACTN|nr:DUF6010 family protein [Streptomonospora nanhaiensis]NYI95328.1 hypothetical protein [Streptomonospora nanhaiensis]